ncbi:MAG: glycosyltransferase family 2 protein [Planctomycetes bacterium]|nr:glycosyltransferase family 2 protein [Planctomycetota bacterium]MBI3848168.1 glycosyltransferase family 2 protein [Planctomycetota bacterium]
MSSVSAQVSPSGAANEGSVARDPAPVSTLELSIVIPCLNEAETIGLCVEKAQAAIRRLGIAGEVVVADNGSTDDSRGIAERQGARVVPVAARGYGAALTEGFRRAHGRFLIMGDADDSYDFSAIDDFVDELRRGADLVMGTRLRGTIDRGAMPFLHRHLGTPVLTFAINRFFKTRISDCNCGMRGIRKDALERLDLRATGMEFASEMVLKSALYGLEIVEIPIHFHKDRRSRPPHLRTWRDGWRHLRFILLFAPNYVFLLPGLVATILGFVLLLTQLNGPLDLGVVKLDYHFMFLGSTLAISGFQLVLFGIAAKIFSHVERFHQQSRMNRLFDRFRLETGLVLGVVLFLAGFGYDLAVLVRWARNGFTDLHEMRHALVGMTFLVIGLQTIFFSFLYSMLGIERRGGILDDRRIPPGNSPG